MRWMSAFLLLAWLGLAGCSQLGYYAQAVRGQVRLLVQREPIERMLDDPATPAELRSQLVQVLEAREFASRELGLPDNDSYRSYVEIDGPYVVWNLFAAPEFSVQPRSWCFPVVGCVSYKGYFSEQAARKEAAKLDAQGYDTFVGGVAAYSTLGRFDDPLLSSMLRWDEASMVGLIFHELAHQQLYTKDDTAFNEAFATLVEEEGVRRWLLERNAAGALEEWRVRRARREEFATLVVGARAELEALYARPLDSARLRTEKAAALELLRARYQVVKAAWGGYSGYDAWFEQELNNAKLSSVATYRRLVPAFSAMLAEHGGDFAAFFAHAAALADLPAAEREQRLRKLMAVSVAAH